MWHLFGLKIRKILIQNLPWMFSTRQHLSTNLKADVMQVSIEILLGFTGIATDSLAFAFPTVFLLVANSLAHNIIIN